MKTLIIRAALVLGIFGLAFLFAWFYMQPDYKTLPYYNPSDVNEELYDISLKGKGRGHIIQNFRLTDQEGKTFTEQQLKGKVYMADFFFTTCPSICLDMAKTKRWLQTEMESYPDFLMVSHTVMPEVDSVSVMAAYANAQNAQYGRWFLLTGQRDSIYKLARQSYLVAKEPSETEKSHDFIHTENFVLVDREGRIRGFYNGTDLKDVERLAADAKWLLNRP